MFDSDTLVRFFTARGTRSHGADRRNLDQLTACNPSMPVELLELLEVQNGEDWRLSLELPYTFMSVDEIVESIRWHRGMVREEELLVPAFIDFVPFIRSGLKTTVGVFTSSNLNVQGQVVEYCYETGRLVSWAPSVGDFISGIASGEGVFSAFGNEFPPCGMQVVDVGGPIDNS